jgi:hypothetical protein
MPAWRISLCCLKSVEGITDFSVDLKTDRGSCFLYEKDIRHMSTAAALSGRSTLSCGLRQNCWEA